MNKPRVRGLLSALLGAALGPSLLPLSAQTLPVVDPRGIPYAAIDAEPTLGKILACNAAYALAVVRLHDSRAVEPGLRVALRRDGVIVSLAYVESVEPGSLATLHYLRDPAYGMALTAPAVGDELIRLPHASPGWLPNP